MQALYAFMQSDNNRMDVGERQLLGSIDKIHHLFVWQLSFLHEVNSFARRRMEENKKKMLPTHEDLHPNTRFVDNQMTAAIGMSTDFNTLCHRYKVNWSLQEEILRKFYKELRETEAYTYYMEKEENTFEDDRNLFLFIVTEMLVNFELLQYFYEEKDIHWVDDYDTVLILLERTLKGWKEQQIDHSLPPLIRANADGDEEDRIFGKHLFRKVLLNISKYDSIIEKKISNWEFDRVAKVDIILLRMAVCEFLEFPSIPVKVTINEYIDISKIFSSPKSKLFINGMLDKLAIFFREEGTLNKSGRGLIDH